jgi:D-beta-D-heptose 7-phosphate kinase/D-beta-D-heptose 1-phosphate adenosyltransferase
MPDWLESIARRIPRIHVLVIGDVMLDHYVWGDATRISPEAPVPVVDISKDTWTAGGAANVALNLVSLGALCTLAGYIGSDDAGRRLSELLSGRGVKVVSTPGRGPTIVKTRVLVQHQQLCRLDREAAPADYAFPVKDARGRLDKAIRGADAVILSDYAKGILHNDLVAHVTQVGRKAGKFIALDPKPKRPLRFHGLDLITPNKREALQLAGMSLRAPMALPADQLCAELHRRHATRHTVVTLGEEGMLLSTEGRVVSTLPTAAREVYDVSGAGDTALSALVLGLVAGAGLVPAARFANAAAGVVVGKLGTATTSLAEVSSFVAGDSTRNSRAAKTTVEKN